MTHLSPVPCRVSLTRISRNVQLGVSLLVVLLVVLGGALAGVLAPYSPVEAHIADRFAPPGSQYLLGTDEFGRDILSRLLYGARAELAVALGATTFAALAGVTLGLVGGYFSSWAEVLSLRFADAILAFPPIMVALLTVTIVGPGVAPLIAVIGLLFTPRFVRITYAETLSIKRAQYVEASRSLGATDMRLIFRTVLPNAAAPIIVQISLSIAAAILLESGLSFLGLGIVPPTPSWGLMVASARRYMLQDPWYLLIPSVVITVTILAFGLLGDVLRDRLDPRRRGSGNLSEAG